MTSQVALLEKESSEVGWFESFLEFCKERCSCLIRDKTLDEGEVLTGGGKNMN